MDSNSHCGKKERVSGECRRLPRIYIEDLIRWMTLSVSGRNLSGLFILLGPVTRHPISRAFTGYTGENKRDRKLVLVECREIDITHTKSIMSDVMRLENYLNMGGGSGMPVRVVENNFLMFYLYVERG